jgi:adenine-specific DNA-methyltransferase
VVKYIGSKRVLVPRIAQVVADLPVRSACDLFSGTTRVAQALRTAGLVVHANDTASYSEMLGLAYVASTPDDRRRLPELLDHLRAVPGRDGYVTETFCRQARYFQPHNGMRIDAIRDEIDRLELSPVERGLVLTSLLEAADRVDSTCGLQMAYVKQWAPRSRNELDLREPVAVEGPAGTVSRTDARELAGDVDVDLVYLDPPYNQHSYFSNYHVWETLVRWDAPEHYGVACKRVDCRTTKSPFNSKRLAWDAFVDTVEAVRAPWLVVSFSNEGFHDVDDVCALLGQKGYVARVEVDHARYVGARIGIHNPQGEKVGTVSHVRNRESLFVVGPRQTQVARAVA